MAELQEVLAGMGKQKATDKNGVVAELLKSAEEGFLAVLANFFSDILCPNASVPTD